MICEKCKNRAICKYYAFILDAPMIINIESCEKADIPTIQKVEETRPRFREPIVYNNIEETNNDYEERIEVDLSEETHDNVLSITDILMGGNNDGPTKES